MIATIQISNDVYGWSETSFTLHQFNDESKAKEFAQEVANELSRVVRIAYPSEGVTMTLDYVSRLSGTYIYPKA